MSDNLDKNINNRIGTHCWGTNPVSVASVPTFARAGARWLRATRQTQMEVVMPGPGRYEFPAAGEESVDLALKSGMSIMAILDGRWGNETRINKLPWASPIWEHLDAWSDFVRASVKYYKGRIKYWEVINEPPFFWWYPYPEGVTYTDINPPLKRAPIRHYAELLKATAKAIRETDPEAKIISGAGFPDGVFLRHLYENGCRDSFDIAGVHYIGCKHPDDFARGIKTLRSIMAEYGDKDKPLWDTESGPGGAVIGLAVQTPDEYEGLFNIYRHCFTHEFGLDRYFWFNPANAPEAGVSAAQCSTALKTDGSLAPAYQALRTLVDAVGEGPLKKCQHIDSEVHAYVFDGPKGPVTIIWSTAPAVAKFPKGTEAKDWQGVAVKLDGEVKLSGRPFFVAGDLLANRLDATVKGKRETVVECWENKRAAADTPSYVSPRTLKRLSASESDWSKIPFVASRAEISVPKQQDHFTLLPTSVGADLKMAHDEEALYLFSNTYDDQLDHARPTGFIQFTVRDGNPSVAEWPYFTNSYGLFTLILGKSGPRLTRYDTLYVDEYPGCVLGKKVELVIEPKADGIRYFARIPWKEIGPCRPGKFNPFYMMFTFNRADNMVDVPADCEPEEWSHNWADNFICKKPPLARMVCFE